jgi:hypothetical protein
MDHEEDVVCLATGHEVDVLYLKMDLVEVVACPMTDHEEDGVWKTMGQEEGAAYLMMDQEEDAACPTMD